MFVLCVRLGFIFSGVLGRGVVSKFLVVLGYSL